MNPARDTGRLRWVIWLLAAAVLAPTAGLLWLISRGVESERLAVRQRLAESYQRIGETAVADLERAWQEVAIPPGGDSAPAMKQVAGWLDPARPGPRPDAVALLDNAGAIVFPCRPDGGASGRRSTDDPLFQSAWRLEFVEDNPVAAAQVYRAVGDRQPDPGVRLAGRASAVRCLAKSGRVDEAIALAASSADLAPEEELDTSARALCFRLRLRRAELLAEGEPAAAAGQLGTLLRELTGPEAGPVPSADRLLVLRRGLAGYQRLAGDTADPTLVSRVERWLASESLAKTLFADVDGLAGLLHNPRAVLFRLEDIPPRFGAVVDSPGGHALLVYSADTLTAFVRQALTGRMPPELILHIAAPGERIAPSPTGLRLVDLGLGSAFPGWRVAGELAAGQPLEDAARRRTALIAWIGFLLIGLLVTAGAISIQLVSREIRFHRLKNDFVATVTHELKTPLASTRVLVDTLLENGGGDECQRTEYLDMISRENARLTGLIDRFLTFSRMERGKQTVSVGPCDPAELVDQAVAAVQMHCREPIHITIELEPGLSTVQADPEAMVTVLVNLLENSVKYSGEDKRIRVRVFREQGLVHFAVADHGVGIPRRARKRVFGKFYQVDQSLSRAMGGCGLGLSIVDYLVRQHRGRVSVDSKVGVGSTFTVKLPAS